MFKTYTVFQIFHWLTYDDMEFESELNGPFWVEISSNGTKKHLRKKIGGNSTQQAQEIVLILDEINLLQ